MGKGKGGGSHKVTFGKRKTGQASKSQGPKQKRVSKYRGQGR